MFEHHLVCLDAACFWSTARPFAPLSPRFTEGKGWTKGTQAFLSVHPSAKRESTANVPSSAVSGRLRAAGSKGAEDEDVAHVLITVSTTMSCEERWAYHERTW